MKPIVHGLEYRYYDQIVFTYLDVDDPATRELKSQLRFRYQPHFILFDGDGNILQQWFGMVREADFVTAFEAALQ
jgi:thioredoxin-related protein